MSKFTFLTSHHVEQTILLTIVPGHGVTSVYKLAPGNVDNEIFISRNPSRDGVLGARGRIRLKVLDGAEVANISRKSSYTEVVRDHSWLLYVKWEKLERVPGSRAAGLPTEGPVCLCGLGRSSRKELLGEIKCGRRPSTSREHSLRRCPYLCRKGLEAANSELAIASK